MLYIFARRRLDERTHQSPWKAHPGAGCIGARCLPHGDGFVILVEVEAHFLKHGFGIVLDQFELLVGEGFIGPDGAPDEARLPDSRGGAGSTAGIGAAATRTASGRGGGSGLNVGHGPAC